MLAMCGIFLINNSANVTSTMLLPISQHCGREVCLCVYVYSIYNTV